MSLFLHRLGRAAARRARLVVLGWLVVLLAAGVAAVGLGGQLQQNLTIPGTESQEGIDLLDQRFPLLAGTSGQVLFAAPEGDEVAEHRAEIRGVLDRIEQVDEVEMAVDPFGRGSEHALSDDGRHALAQVQLAVPLDDLDQATVDEIEQAAQVDRGTDLEVHLGGQIFTTTEVALSATEVVGVLVALAVLAVTFGSLVAAGLPIVTAVLGVGVTMAGMLALASAVTITSSTPTLALMIGLAVGIDYALFIIYRHRAQLATGMAVEESVARSVATAGSAVVFAGATVVIALCGLVVARIPFLSVMGFAAAAGVAVAVAVSLSFVPAVLGMLGERLRPGPRSRAARHALAPPERARTLGAAWVRWATRVPALTVVVVGVGLVVMALPARDLALGLPDNGTKQPGSGPRVTYDLVSEVYGPGHNGPLLVTTDIIRSTDPLTDMERLGEDIAAMDGVAVVPLATPNPDADLGIVQVVPETAQTDPRTADLVRDLRDRAGELEEQHGVTDLRVTGQTAVAIDVSDRLSGALLPFGLVVVGLSLVLLTIVFRSVAVPIKATLGYLLSVGASFGAVAAVFEWGWFAEVFNVARVGPVISFLPIILMGVLFGLAMDYEVFLVSRMREDYVHTGDPWRAVTTGFTASARVVTAAAVIMISVFVAFVPHGDSIVKPIAFGLAVGVFVDAFLVRMTLVPAVLALLGRRAWWLPAWLDRRLPRLDVEGEALQHHLEHQAWEAEHGPAAVRAVGAAVPDEQGDPLHAPVDAVVRPGTLYVVRGDRPLARAALLAAFSGRLDAEGTLVVGGRLLPDEAGAVRARTWFHDSFPPAELLEREVAGSADEAPLVVVDGVDARVRDDRLPERWRLLSALVAAGATVVAGTTAPPPDDIAHDGLDLTDPVDATRPEELPA